MDTTVYRVWGGTALEVRPWVSPYNYGLSSKSLLSLPPDNTMANTTIFIISNGTKALTGTAAPLYDQLGGGVQWWVAGLFA